MASASSEPTFSAVSLDEEDAAADDETDDEATDSEEAAGVTVSEDADDALADDAAADVSAVSEACEAVETADAEDALPQPASMESASAPAMIVETNAFLIFISISFLCKNIKRLPVTYEAEACHHPFHKTRKPNENC